MSNFVSRSICSPQFDAASIKTEQHSLQTEWRVVYGTLRNHHLVALRVELKRSKLCFIFRGYAISKKRKRKKFGFASLCCKYFLLFWHPFARTLFGHMSTDLLLLRGVTDPQLKLWQNNSSLLWTLHCVYNYYVIVTKFFNWNQTKGMAVQIGECWGQ